MIAHKRRRWAILSASACTIDVFRHIHLFQGVAVAAEELRRPARSGCQDGLPFFHHLDIIGTDAARQGIANVGEAGCHVLLAVHVVRHIAAGRQDGLTETDHMARFFGGRNGGPQFMME